MTPRATYRLQFTAAFGFADAAALAPYLAALGVSHVYASPIFAARPGSTHGYDGVDPNRLNPELGTPAEFRAMVAALRAEGLGLVLDVVPNHLGIGGAANPFWLDVLARGPASRSAAWFDIDWRSRYPGLAGKVLVPFLGDQYGAVLAEGGLELRFDPENGSFAVWAHESHKLPINPDHYGRILDNAPNPAPLPRDPAGLAEASRDPAIRREIDAAVAAFRGRAGDRGSWAALDALIADQHWRAAKFTLAGEAINYRRFFTISDLAGIRVEDPDVFDATHRLLLDLVAEGLVDGIRIDHIDGLRDPKAYCLRLRAHTARPVWLLVEKILAPDEALPPDWGTDGTTGYEVTNLLVGLLTDPAGSAALDAAYAGFTGRSAPPAEIVHAAKRAIMAGPMAAETAALTARLHALARRDPTTCDLGPVAIGHALVETAAALDVYRTYADADGLPAGDRPRIAAAVAEARRRQPDLDPLTFDFLERILACAGPSDPDAMEAVARAQQLTGPVMAKGLEDTALYRYNRLIALNEVGSEPGRFHVDPAAFHAANLARATLEPRAMLTTSTHDTKRGEDARMRIAALAGHPETWAAAADDWREALRPESAAIDPNDVYFFFQLLIGVWPAGWRAETPLGTAELDPLADRIDAAMLKSVREAGEHTRWVFGDPRYEAAVTALVRRALAPGDGNDFLRRFRAFETRIAADGAQLGLIQTVLKLTIPGVPDIYQGAEVWEQSLVDPDNRRPVDFAGRAAALAALRADGRPPSDRDRPDGTAKLAITAALLDLRRRMPELFADAGYTPLAAEGPGGADVLAFTRAAGPATLTVVAALRPARPPGADTRLTVAGRWQDVLSGRTLDDPDLTDLLAALPVAVLLQAEGG